MLRWLSVVAIIGFLFVAESVNAVSKDPLECHGKVYSNVTLAAYFPDFDDDSTEFGYIDKRGKKLRTLQDYLDDRADFVTIAMDSELAIPYGAPVCCPELNKHFGRRIFLQVRDSGSDLRGHKYARADICVRTETDSYDNAVNRQVTFIF